MEHRHGERYQAVPVVAPLLVIPAIPVAVEAAAVVGAGIITGVAIVGAALGIEAWFAGRENVMPSDLADKSVEELQRALDGLKGRLTAEQKKKKQDLIKALKYRRQRNKQKRGG